MSLACKSRFGVKLFEFVKLRRSSSIFTNYPFLSDFCHGSYSGLIKNCLTDEGNNEFWRLMANHHIQWNAPFTSINKCDLQNASISWFDGGKLNVSENCIDRYALADPERIALIWEKDEPGQEEFVTYQQLKKLVHRMSNVLTNHGVKKGDRIVIYMPVTPLIVASMLACARIGAIHSVVFAGFSPDALAARIQDANAHIVITANQAVRGGRVIELKRTVDEAVSKCPENLVKHVFVQSRTDAKVVMKAGRDIFLNKALEDASNKSSPKAIVSSVDPLFILYTSGSTGKPKGIVHSSAGYLLYAAMTHSMVFDIGMFPKNNKNDRFGCVADVGWITGHSYVVYGPLCNGSTTLLFESTPTYPNPGRYWEMVERLRLSHIYLAPTALRLLLKYGDEWVQKYDRSSLRKLGCVGEPLNHEAWEWYHKVVGEKRCDIVDTWWQTETGGILISPRPSAEGAPIEPGKPMRPLPGIDVSLVDVKGEELPVSTSTSPTTSWGALCVNRPWPGLAQSIWNDHERFKKTYFETCPGKYFAGDGAFVSKEGYFQITGRIDDVINTSGHRLGTAEIEDVLDEHPCVAESAVVGFPHPVKGEAVYAFVTLKEKVTDSEKDIRFMLRELVKNKVASYAMPEIIQITANLPKTRSGKIMRRILKKIAASDISNLGDTSTLADPSVVDSLIENHKRLLDAKKATEK